MSDKECGSRKTSQRRQQPCWCFPGRAGPSQSTLPNAYSSFPVCYPLLHPPPTTTTTKPCTQSPVAPRGPCMEISPPCSALKVPEVLPCCFPDWESPRHSLCSGHAASLPGPRQASCFLPRGLHCFHFPRHSSTWPGVQALADVPPQPPPLQSPLTIHPFLKHIPLSVPHYPRPHWKVWIFVALFP